MSDNALKTFRDRNTGLVEVYPASIARTFPYLELVEDGAKTLINPPVSDEAVAGHIAHHKASTDEGEKPAKTKE